MLLKVSTFTLTPGDIVTQVNGKAMPVTVEEYKEKLAEQLIAEAPTLESFRKYWTSPAERQKLMSTMPDGGRAPLLIRELRICKPMTFMM